MGDKALRGNRLTRKDGGRTNLLEELGRVEAEPSNRNRRAEIRRVHSELNKGYKDGGRTNLLEELGRVDAEPSNRNRRAEIARVHGELNRGYAKGGRAGFEQGEIVKRKKMDRGIDWKKKAGKYQETYRPPQQKKRERQDFSRKRKEFKKGVSDKNWIQKATASIKRRGTKGVCTGKKFGGPTCRPGTKRYNLAKTFKKMARKG